jgi:hypothetical protein
MFISQHDVELAGHALCTGDWVSASEEIQAELPMIHCGCEQISVFQSFGKLHEL